jgi:ATPase subunit of ABC transporter with duplicated ATPase domains
LDTQIWEIDETKGMLRTFKGSYSQYHQQRLAEQLVEKEAAGRENQSKRSFEKAAVSAERQKQNG